MTNIGIALRGMAMGIAEVIPGVSGGTIAFITGIYKTLIDTIKSVDHNLVGLIFKGRFREVWKSVNGPFLLPLIIGMGGGVVCGVFGVSHLLDNYPEALWALFFGLILASIPYMVGEMKDRNWIHLVPFIIGAVVAYALTSLSPAEGSTNYLYVFFAGVIAISALVLPGISGSFILLLLGLYTIIIPTIKSFLKSPELSEFMMLGVFGLGCLTGLIVFSRIVSAAFEKFHDGTIAIMSGFMLGSLNKIWPWRNPELVLNKDTGAKTIIDANNISSFNASEEAIKILDEANVMPEGYYGNPRVGLVLAAFVIGLILIYLLYLSQSKKSKK